MKKFRSIFIILFLFFVLSACSKNIGTRQNIVAGSEAGQQAVNVEQAADRLEVYYFHRTQRCISCLTIGEYINKTMLEYFSGEIASGRIDYGEINIDLPENKDLAYKFQASGSSLFINAVRGENEDIQNVPEVWNWKSDEQIFNNNLKQKIDKLLGK